MPTNHRAALQWRFFLFFVGVSDSMNKTYKSVWNETTGSWVAVSELEKGRSKSKRAKTAISKAILAQVAVGGLGLVSASSVFAVTDGSATGTNATAIGTSSIADVTDGVAIGTGALATLDTGPSASKTGAIAIGSGAEGDGSGVAIGVNTNAGSDSLALGANATASLQSVAIGNNARSYNTSAVAIGDGAVSGAAQALALGANASASATGAVALGANSVANRANTISVGSALIKRQITNVAAGTQDNDAVNLAQIKALGLQTDSNGNPTNSFVAYDAGSSNGKVTLAGGTAGTTITNLAAGAIGASSKDAVNGSQLFALASSTAAALGAGSKMNPDGSVTAPVYTIDGKNTSSLQDALDKAAAAGGGGTDANAVHYDDASTKATVTLGGSGAAPVKLTNVADGTSGSDAVNYKQLQSVAQDASAASSQLRYMSFSNNSGGAANASGNDSVAVGGNSAATGNQALAFGAGARATADNSVAVGYGSSATVSGTFSVGSSKNTRRIVNVTAGTATTDAVNLGQVQSLLAAQTTTFSSATHVPLASRSDEPRFAGSARRPRRIQPDTGPTNCIGSDGEPDELDSGTGYGFDRNRSVDARKR
ncbi:ESPR-type extended signal peptide-containing protein [Caballeronia telluris]|uniref:YadA domain-containing protein n=1 Tax=Caballeronia telluris TaxID=326475 RepID=A0A158JMD4_9BURK|nr:ESPR-type extended signal peptide-containing protein [Caballeronia telluris]SAL69633.1 YadA domain-containing protein [Caballeronia telluris]